MENKEILEIFADTSGADKFFVEGFINVEMAFDFWIIARDFLQHHYPRLKEFNDIAENCMNVPETNELTVVFQNRIMNMIYNAAKNRDEYAIALLQEIYKTYYKKEYKQLKRFRSISFSEVCALSKTEDEDYDFFTIARILSMCEIYGIHIEESCYALYLMLNKNRNEWDEIYDVSYLQFDKELYKECILQVQEWILERKSEKNYQRAERFAELCLEHNGYAADYLYLCSQRYHDSEKLYTDTLAFLKTAYPKKKFTFDEVQIYALLCMSIDALVSTCDECHEDITMMLGVSPDWHIESDISCKFHPENIKIAESKERKKVKKISSPVPKIQKDIPEHEYLQEIQKLRSQLREKERECKHYRQQYDQMKSELIEAKEIIEKHDSDREELIALRNHVYSFSEEVLPIKEETLQQMQEVVAKRKIAIVGGHINWINKLKKDFPNWKYLDADITRSNHSESFENVEKVYFYTAYLSHGTYGKFIAMVREKDIPFGYLSSINKDSLVKQIYRDFSQK